MRLISSKDLERFEYLRTLVFKFIEKSKIETEFLLGYEGTFYISFPAYLDTEYSIVLNSYLVHPRCHNKWKGTTFKEALDIAEQDILWLISP